MLLFCPLLHFTTSDAKRHRASSKLRLRLPQKQKSLLLKYKVLDFRGKSKALSLSVFLKHRGVQQGAPRAVPIGQSAAVILYLDDTSALSWRIGRAWHRLQIEKDKMGSSLPQPVETVSEEEFTCRWVLIGHGVPWLILGSAPCCPRFPWKFL